MDKRTKQDSEKEQDPTTPGPTTGGMRSMGPQPGEPTLEEKLGVVDEADEEQGEARQVPGTVRDGPPQTPERTADEKPVGTSKEQEGEPQQDEKPLGRPPRGDQKGR